MDVPHRYALWVGAVREWCDRPGPSFPSAEVSRLIGESFEAASVGWNWRDPDSSFGTELDREVEGSSLSDPAVLDWILQLRSTHPLLVWFVCSRDPLAMSELAHLRTAITLPGRGYGPLDPRRRRDSASAHPHGDVMAEPAPPLAAETPKPKQSWLSGLGPGTLLLIVLAQLGLLIGGRT